MDNSITDIDDLIEYAIEQEDSDVIILHRKGVGQLEDFKDEGVEEVLEEFVEDEDVKIDEMQIDDLRDQSKKTNVSTHKGPKRFLLFDNLVAEVVDYDEVDGAPIVEFSMCVDEDEEGRLPVECGICPDVMHKTKLSKHIQTHIKAGTKRFMCIYCEENFVSRAYAAGHARRHMGIRPYVCLPCKLYYCTKQDLRVHQQRRHWAKEHICEQCGKAFAQHTSLKNHRSLVHDQQRRFGCVQCGKRFLRNYAMKEHVRNVHMGDRRPLDCPFCDMRFKDTHKLAQHRKDMHLQQSMFECRACGLEFTSIDFFDAHRRSLQCRKKYKEREEAQIEEGDQQFHEEELEKAPKDEVETIDQVHKLEKSTSNMDDQLEEFLLEITVDNL